VQTWLGWRQSRVKLHLIPSQISSLQGHQNRRY